MDPIQLPLLDGVLYIDNSSMELFTTCPRQAYYNLIRKREINKDRIALSFGESFHAVLDYLYRKYGTAYRSQADNADVLRYAATRELHPPEDDHRTTSYLVSAVAKYLTDYPAEPWELVTLPSGAPAVEVPFMYPLGTIESKVFGPIKIVWTGRIDLMYRSRGKLGIMDHKTTSMMGTQFFAEFEISHQFYGYTAASEYILGEPVSEVAINGLGCRKPTRTGTALEFQRHIIPISRPLVDEWHHDCLTIVANYISYAETGYFPKHTKWCVGKYGPCQYRSICTLDPAHRDIALSTSEYRDVTWNPLHKDTP